MTIAMLSLAGFPATAGFFGKIYLIGAAVDNGYTWLGVVIVLGSAISLAYYLRVVAAVWMRGAGRARPPASSAARARRSRAARRRPTPTRRRLAAGAARRGRERRLVQPEVVGLARGLRRGVDRSSASTRARCSTSRKDAGAALTNLF